MTGRWGRRRKQLLDELKEKRRYWKFKEEALDRTLWRSPFGRGYGRVVRQTTEWMTDFRANTSFSNTLKLCFCITDSKLCTHTRIKGRTGSLISLMAHHVGLIWNRKCCLPCSHKQHTERSEAAGVQSPPRSGTKNRKRLTGSRLLHDTQDTASYFLTRAFFNFQSLMVVTWITLPHCMKRNAYRVWGEGGRLKEWDHLDT
jgi:hypothetical protein